MLKWFEQNKIRLKSRTVCMMLGEMTHGNTEKATSLFYKMKGGGSIHPSIFVCLSGAGSRGQLPEQGHPDFPLPGHFLQLFQEDPKAFPGQLGDIVTPACPGSSSGSPPSGICQEHLLRKASRGHPI